MGSSEARVAATSPEHLITQKTSQGVGTALSRAVQSVRLATPNLATLPTVPLMVQPVP